jgi:hypothetical protein
MSDGSAFTGTLGFGTPYEDDNVLNHWIPWIKHRFVRVSRSLCVDRWRSAALLRHARPRADHSKPGGSAARLREING